MVNGVPVPGGTVAGATGTISSVTSTVGSVTGSVSGVTGSLSAGVVTGTISGAMSSVTGTACTMSSLVSGVTGSVTGTATDAAGVTGVLPGGWVVDGTIVPTVVQDGPQHLLARVDRSWSFLSTGTTSWVNYTVSSVIKTDAGTGVAGIAARVIDAANYYSCQVVNGTSMRLVKVVGGKLSVLTQSGGQVLTPDTFHTVSMVVTGNHVGCLLDGQTVLQSVDGTLTHGQVGLVGLGSLPAEFGAFKVLSLPTSA
jgi:hypothetical protein